MKAKNNVSKESSKVLKFSGDEMFFRGEHPDKRSNKEWVAYMNNKYPHLKWNGKESKNA